MLKLARLSIPSPAREKMRGRQRRERPCLMSGNNHHTALKESKTFGPVPDPNATSPRMVAHPVQCRLPQDRRRRRREFRQHRERRRFTRCLRRSPPGRRHPRSLLRPGAPRPGTRPARLPARDRPRPLPPSYASRASATSDAAFRPPFAGAREAPPGPESFDCVSLMGNSFGYFERAEDDLAAHLGLAC